MLKLRVSDLGRRLGLAEQRQPEVWSVECGTRHNCGCMQGHRRSALLNGPTKEGVGAMSSTDLGNSQCRGLYDLSTCRISEQISGVPVAGADQHYLRLCGGRARV